MQQQQQHQPMPRRGFTAMRSPATTSNRRYCLVSALAAFLAIVLSPGTIMDSSSNKNNVYDTDSLRKMLQTSRLLHLSRRSYCYADESDINDDSLQLVNTMLPTPKAEEIPAVVETLEETPLEFANDNSSNNDSPLQRDHIVGRYFSDRMLTTSSFLSSWLNNYIVDDSKQPQEEAEEAKAIPTVQEESLLEQSQTDKTESELQTTEIQEVDESASEDYNDAVATKYNKITSWMRSILFLSHDDAMEQQQDADGQQSSHQELEHKETNDDDDNNNKNSIPSPSVSPDESCVNAPTITTTLHCNNEGIYEPHSNIIALFDPVLVQQYRTSSLLKYNPDTLAHLTQKVLSSTTRLVAVINFVLYVVFLLHAGLAKLFLGSYRENNATNNGATTTTTAGVVPAPGSSKDKLVIGYLVLKMLLVSSVIIPSSRNKLEGSSDNTMDLLIIMSWYTVLSFLRSLAQLCADTTRHTSQSGQEPRKGVLYLLTLVLLGDILAAATGVGFFYDSNNSSDANWNILALLACDCILIALDVSSFILQHCVQLLEQQYSNRVEQVGSSSMTQEDDTAEAQLEMLEQQHNRQMSTLDICIFAMQLASKVLAVVHFVHIWTLHGFRFTLIDGIIALHIRSAASKIYVKIIERRNISKIARELDDKFQDASELEIRKANASGDVCCICLASMQTGVKKIGCGHLYHTSCLREVIERARSIQAAKCPLCRGSVLDGQYCQEIISSSSQSEQNDAPVQETVQPEWVDRTTAAMIGESLDDNSNNNNNSTSDRSTTGTTTTTTTPAIAATNNVETTNNAVHIQQEEQALFRFSTDNILPAWIPVPAFSFEVVRRPRSTDAAVQPSNSATTTTTQNAQQPSFLRRLLVLSGTIPMSAEEESAAIEQLVDMFPQYDRADLLRELRLRGSAEGVAESVLMGVFSGSPRGQVH